MLRLSGCTVTASVPKMIQHKTVTKNILLLIPNHLTEILIRTTDGKMSETIKLKKIDMPV